MTQSETKSHQWLVTCPKGLELLLTAELTELGAESARETVAGAYCQADLTTAYRICLWSRLANRVLLQLDQFECNDADQLYEAATKVDWQAHFGSDDTFAVRFTGGSREIGHTGFGALRVKDGVADYFRALGEARPNVDSKQPDIWINARLSKNQLSLALDFAGDSLHRRRYRVASVTAPLKENLASALLLRSRWPEIASQGGALIDPMCGSGTLLIEGALMAADIAPGLLREEHARLQPGKSAHGFENWRGHDSERWAELLAEARQRRNEGLARGLPEIRGYDIDGRAIRAAEENIQQAGLVDWVRVSKKSLNELKQPTHKTLENGLVICNPPYGERLGDQEALRSLYYQLGERLKAEFPGWQAAIFTGNPELGPEMNLRAHKQYKLFNGAIPARLLLFAIDSEPRTAIEKQEPGELSEGAKMFANRVQKNLRKLQPWLKREGIECYRLYDADMPEYAVAVDIFGDAVHLQEYEPPATVDERAARKRLREAKSGLLQALQIDEKQLYFKQRRRQKGRDQYQRQIDTRSAGVLEVCEGQARFEVNMQGYLDTGLFLDHRPLRRMIFRESAGKRVLNLFCYTASISVQAALGGASQSLSIDMSQTYLDWAKRNFGLNQIDTYRHRLLRADCLQWLADEKNQQEQEFDLIVLDPPTFSNSKKMEGILDIQRDHGKLIRQAMRMLAPGGVLYFSNNFRRFKMDGDILERLDVEELGVNSIDPDFQRNPKIHNCWKIKRRHV